MLDGSKSSVGNSIKKLVGIAGAGEVQSPHPSRSSKTTTRTPASRWTQHRAPARGAIRSRKAGRSNERDNPAGYRGDARARQSRREDRGGQDNRSDTQPNPRRDVKGCDAATLDLLATPPLLEGAPKQMDGNGNRPDKSKIAKVNVLFGLI